VTNYQKRVVALRSINPRPIESTAHVDINIIETIMAPPPPPRTPREPSIPYTPEYNEFIAKLTAYHEKRGTHLDPEPRVGSKHVDLLHLFNTVVQRGGYDKVSDEKLAWRKLGQDFNLGTNNLPALAFSLKSTYYKYLAAYEISTVYGKEPPPREILEDTTAKGGGLLTRTLENYRPSARRETGALGNEQSEASGDDGTPARDRHGSEETPGSGGRVTRGLRQAPPQRILFQPDTQPSRQSRVSATSHPPTSQHHQQQQQQQPRGASTSYNPSSNMENMSHTVTNYEPRPQMPLTLRPVITPGNNPVEYSRRQRALREATAAANRLAAPAPRLMLPGCKFIVSRCSHLCS
jgi:chromatin structure-remodeling complex subunit RSC9